MFLAGLYVEIAFFIFSKCFVFINLNFIQVKLKYQLHKLQVCSTGVLRKNLNVLFGGFGNDEMTEGSNKMELLATPADSDSAYIHTHIQILVSQLYFLHQNTQPNLMCCCCL